MHLVLKPWIPFSQSASKVHVSHAVEEDRGDKRPVDLELACKADGVAPSDPA